MLIRAWDVVSFPLNCFFPIREWCLNIHQFFYAKKFAEDGKIEMSKSTFKKVFQLTNNSQYKKRAAYELMNIYIKEHNCKEAFRYFLYLFSVEKKNKEKLMCEWEESACGEVGRHKHFLK